MELYKTALEAIRAEPSTLPEKGFTGVTVYGYPVMILSGYDVFVL